MERQKNKIKIKGVTKKLLLKKSYINNQNILVLNKPVNNIINKNSVDINLVKENIIKINKSTSNNNIISLKNISKKLGGKPIIKDISFSLEQGKILGLLGPNGSGKSTLFNMIMGKILPDAGEIKFLNENILNLQIHERALKGMSLLEQHKGLFENMTAYENLYAILELYINDKNKIEDKISHLLSFFNLNYLKNIKACNMSGGEYKKISTLQRICNKNIKLLLLDEPMAALDPISIDSIKNFLLELKSIGLSIIITDHNFYAIHDILDECLIIREGTIMTSGKPKDVIKDKNTIKYYLGSGFKI